MDRPAGAPRIPNLELLGSEFMKHFTLVVAETVDAMAEGAGATATGKDLMVDYGRLVEALRASKNQYRFLYQPLLFLKQHRNLLLHVFRGCREVDVRRCLSTIGDVIVWLGMFRPGGELRDKYIRFYAAYRACAAEHCSVVVPDEQFAAVAEGTKPPTGGFDPHAAPLSPGGPAESSGSAAIGDPAPLVLKGSSETLVLKGSSETLVPNHRTIHWFKANGLSEFLKGKVIIPQAGPYQGRECVLIRYNGNNCRVRLLTDPAESDGKYISRYMQVEWRDAQN